MSSVLTRRDRCHLIGRRAARLTPPEAAEAWYNLAQKVEDLGMKDIPKFNDLLIAVRIATLRQKPNVVKEWTKKHVLVKPIALYQDVPMTGNLNPPT